MEKHGNDMEFGVETTGHDYCSVPEAAALHLALMKNEELSKEVEDLRHELEEIAVQNRFGLQRFAGSDEDIRFYTRFATYNHLMAFWQLIEPATHQLIRVTSSKVTREEGPSGKETREVENASAVQAISPANQLQEISPIYLGNACTINTGKTDRT
ncbi:hypothetical protein SKAU_G00342230 [Synaphobranchus kaupii]|uniref:Uncharacterized protein n=1 Tax=Synaphobranchus kaupii TaxID=118154 RepID=A0A9Q1END9_SYNKA|nr:hypothetical protein SKAU_G00342230 [Synaphobranchus kaupii]